MLKPLADGGVEISAAEDALGEERRRGGAARLDAADEGLAALRARWPELGPRERRALGAAAQPVRQRLDAARARLPATATLSVGAAEADPEEELDPAAA